MHKQMGFIRNKNLGYNKDHMVVLPIYYRDVQPKYEPFKAELMRNPRVLSATATSFIPSDHGYRQNSWWEGLAADDTDYMMSWISVDHDFVETMGLEVTHGRDFSPEYPLDAAGAYLLNQAAVQMIGWEDPLGKEFEIVERGPVVGIVKDFHFQSLHTKIQPMALHIYPKGFKYLLVRITASDIEQSLQTLRREWQSFFPERLFNYSFFDEDFNRIYKSEAHLLKTSNYITGLAILIACLGLFGLASFTAARRTKEIGIRKVLGAGIFRILALLSQDFVRLVLFGILIAFPFSFFISSRWLQNFAYRVPINIWAFLLVGVAVMLASLVTVLYQAVKAASTDPVKTLRHE
jgi:putative ABC transport system permease protein